MKVILILRMLISVPTIYCYEKPKHAKVMKKTIHSKYSTHRTRKETFFWLEMSQHHQNVWHGKSQSQRLVDFNFLVQPQVAFLDIKILSMLSSKKMFSSLS